MPNHQMIPAGDGLSECRVCGYEEGSYGPGSGLACPGPDRPARQPIDLAVGQRWAYPTKRGEVPWMWREITKIWRDPDTHPDRWGPWRVAYKGRFGKDCTASQFVAWVRRSGAVLQEAANAQ